MSVQLLDKTRKITRLLHNNSSEKVILMISVKVLNEVMDSSVLCN